MFFLFRNTLKKKINISTSKRSKNIKKIILKKSNFKDMQCNLNQLIRFGSGLICFHHTIESLALPFIGI